MNQFLREQRLYNNGLEKKFKNPEICTQSLLGIQSQLHYYGLISIYNRTQNTSIKKIAKSPHLLKSWGQRTTHHIYHKDDFTLINASFNRDTLWSLRYLHENNIDAQSVIDTLRSYCETHDSFTKEDLITLFPESMHETFNVWSALIIIGCTQGLMYVEVREDNTKHYRSAIALTQKPQSTAYLLRQYFTYYGPATIQDFGHWSGLPQREFIKDFETIKDDLYCTDDQYYSVSKPRKRKITYPILLGKFDPLLVSYKDKSWILDDHDSSMIWRKAAHVEGVVIDETGLIATWHYLAKPKSMTYVIKPLHTLDPQKLKQRCDALTAFMNREKTEFILEAPYY